MTEVVQISDYEVVIDGQSYSAIAIPAADSGVVTAERNRLLKNLKLESLISNLLRAGELLTLAYNGVAGFGTLRGAVTSISDRLRVLAGRLRDSPCSASSGLPASSPAICATASSS